MVFEQRFKMCVTERTDACGFKFEFENEAELTREQRTLVSRALRTRVSDQVRDTKVFWIKTGTWELEAEYVTTPADATFMDLDQAQRLAVLFDYPNSEADGCDFNSDGTRGSVAWRVKHRYDVDIMYCPDMTAPDVLEKWDG